MCTQFTTFLLVGIPSISEILYYETYKSIEFKIVVNGGYNFEIRE